LPVFTHEKNKKNNVVLNTSSKEKKKKESSRSINHQHSDLPLAPVSSIQELARSIHQEKPGLQVQPDLTINQAHDTHEQEADRVANDLMKSPSLAIWSNVWPQSTTIESSSTNPLMRSATISAPQVQSKVAEEDSIINQVINSPGQPLEAKTRAFFEPRLGHDLGRVRVHTDSRANESAEAINALAYTVGSHIVFGPGQYAPTSTQGKHLLAHELTHVVQQNGSDRLHPSQGNNNTESGLLSISPARLKYGAQVQSKPKGKGPKVKTIDFSKEPEQIIGIALPEDVSVSNRIESNVRSIMNAKLQFWLSYETALNNFARDAISGEESQKVDFLKVVFTAAFKFALDKFISVDMLEGLLGEAEKVGTAAKNIFDGAKETGKKAYEAYEKKGGGAAKVVDFVNSLSIGAAKAREKEQKALDDSIEPLQTEYGGKRQAKTGTGEAGEALVKLMMIKKQAWANLDKYSVPYWQQQFTEKFVRTGQYSTYISQGGVMSGELHMDVTVIVDEDKKKVDIDVSEWNLRTSAESASKLAPSLKKSMENQSKNIYQSNLPKVIHMQVEKEEIGFNPRTTGVVRFTDDPDTAYANTPWPIILQAYRLAKSKILAMNEIYGSD
jgi:Domain of unknown function (DUF4157)